MKKSLLAICLLAIGFAANAQKIEIPDLPESFPRVVDPSSYKINNRESIDKWLERQDELVGKLQMYWDSHATVVYIGPNEIDHVEGPAAPCPTVRMTAARRSTSTIYKRLPLEDVPLKQDAQGMWLKNTETGECEWADPNKTGRIVEEINDEIIGIAEKAAAIYFQEGDARYASLAAKVFDTYMKGIYYRDVPIAKNGARQMELVGMTAMEVIQEERVINMTMAIYDMLHDYLAAEYGEENMSIYQDAFRKWCDVTIANGVPENNWNLVQMREVLRRAMILEKDSHYADGRGREWYLNEVLNEDSIRQWSIRHMIENGFDEKTALWKECPRYSLWVIDMYSDLVALLRKELSIDIVGTYPILERAIYATAQYTFPNGQAAGWGDSTYKQIKRDYFVSLGEDLTPYLTQSFSAPEISWYVGRSGNDPHNSLMFSAVGAKGNHMHANGISLELYGKGYVQAPDAGHGVAYEYADNHEYYSQYPAHNTVCPDGKATTGFMFMDLPYTLNYCYPEDGHKEFDSPVTFADMSYHEPSTNSDQRRQVIMIATPEGGYYVDIFRSRKCEGGDRFHDYFYHNIGQEFSCNLALSECSDFAEDCIPGYKYYSDVVAASACSDFSGVFTMNIFEDESVGMKMWMRGSTDRKIFKGGSVGPRSMIGAGLPYDVMAVPMNTVIARQKGEAWSRPFTAVYMPWASSDKDFIRKVSFYGKDFEGIKVKRADGKTDIIEAYPDGRLIIRTSEKIYNNR